MAAGSIAGVMDPRIIRLRAAIHENERARFEKMYQNLDFESDAYRIHAKDRRKYIAIDSGSSGKLLVDKETTRVFSIKGYGKPNRYAGDLADLIRQYEQATDEGREIRPG